MAVNYNKIRLFFHRITSTFVSFSWLYLGVGVEIYLTIICFGFEIQFRSFLWTERIIIRSALSIYFWHFSFLNFRARDWKCQKCSELQMNWVDFIFNLVAIWIDWCLSCVCHSLLLLFFLVKSQNKLNTWNVRSFFSVWFLLYFNR